MTGPCAWNTPRVVSALTSEEIDAVAREIAVALCQSEPQMVSGDAGRAATVIAHTIRNNFATEQKIDDEAAAALAAMGPKTAGMDRGTLLAGLRDRIAKKHGFVL